MEADMMSRMAKLVRQKIVDLIRRRKRLILIAVRHRSKFEGWLQYELAADLESDPMIKNVEPERGYEKKGRCDIACDTNRGTWLIELKTCNTSYRVDGVEPKTRPITMNVNGVIKDIKKLRKGCKSEKGLAAFLFFPVRTTFRDQDRINLDDHLDRIEREAKLHQGLLRRDGEFVNLNQHVGVAVFVVEAA